MSRIMGPGRRRNWSAATSAEILAGRLFVVNRETHARWKDDPAKRAAWEELNGMPFDSLLVHPMELQGLK